MKCRTNNHEWTCELDADRCCNPEWKRAMRHISATEDLDKEGRMYRHDLPFVYGWIKIPENQNVSRVR